MPSEPQGEFGIKMRFQGHMEAGFSSHGFPSPESRILRVTGFTVHGSRFTSHELRVFGFRVTSHGFYGSRIPSHGFYESRFTGFRVPSPESRILRVPNPGFYESRILTDLASIPFASRAFFRPEGLCSSAPRCRRPPSNFARTPCLERSGLWQRGRGDRSCARRRDPP